MAQIPFNVSARTARLIGRENVANAEGALIELVKNCYDADSPLVVVLIDKPSDTILILDRGEGMSSKIIKEQWMTIGTDDKLNNPITSTGRIKSGAKGIGRFALDRLGEFCTMITFPRNDLVGNRWIVDWSAFEEKEDGRNKNINEVFADLDEFTSSRFVDEIKKEIKNKNVLKIIDTNDFKQGTLLKIQGLRDSWEDSFINKTYENLELLTPPEGANKLNIWFFNGSEPEKYGLVNNEEYKDYDYKLVASYVKNYNNELNIKIYRNEFDLSLINGKLFEFPDMKEFPFDKETFDKEEYEIKRNFKELLRGFTDNKNIAETIGDFEFVLYFLKNTFSVDDRKKYKYKEFLGDRGKWLKRFGGLKIYRDNFRIRPYGEINTQAYDWLMLGERQAVNPAAVSRKGGFRVRPNQVAGIVKISRITNPRLEDKSSREGIQENETFELFKNLLLGLIKVLEDDRSKIFYNLNELAAIEDQEQRFLEESADIADETDSNKDTPEITKSKNTTLKRGIKVRDKKLREKEDELATSRAMASAGIMIASFSHEFHGIKNDLLSRTNDLKEYISLAIDNNKLQLLPNRKNPLLFIEEIQKQDERLRQWIEFAINLTIKDRRKIKECSLKDYFNNFQSLWIRLFAQKNIVFDYKFVNDEIDYKIKISELDLDTIFDNLLTNTIEAFDRKGFIGKREINIQINEHKNNVHIKYTDSGPGIVKEYNNINDIFNPFETSKKDDLGNDIGTGLGMWLVKSAVDSNKGKIELKRPEKGFEINFFFKVKIT